MIKCENCSKEVIPQKKKFSVLFFILTLILFFPIALIYLIIYLCRGNDYCPHCNKSVYKKTKKNKINSKLSEPGNPTMLYIFRGLVVILIISVITGVAISFIKDMQ